MKRYTPAYAAYKKKPYVIASRKIQAELDEIANAGASAEEIERSKNCMLDDLIASGTSADDIALIKEYLRRGGMFQERRESREAEAQERKQAKYIKVIECIREQAFIKGDFFCTKRAAGFCAGRYDDTKMVIELLIRNNAIRLTKKKKTYELCIDPSELVEALTHKFDLIPGPVGIPPSDRVKEGKPKHPHSKTESGKLWHGLFAIVAIIEKEGTHKITKDETLFYWSYLCAELSDRPNPRKKGRKKDSKGNDVGFSLSYGFLEKWAGLMHRMKKKKGKDAPRTICCRATHNRMVDKMMEKHILRRVGRWGYQICEPLPAVILG